MKEMCFSCVLPLYGSGLPQVVLLTRVDRECSITKDNLRNVYKSKKIRNKVSILASMSLCGCLWRDSQLVHCDWPINNCSCQPIQVRECSNLLGVPANCIFPVSNYHEETGINEDINCLMLDALSQMVDWANDFVVQCSSTETHVEWVEWSIFLMLIR